MLITSLLAASFIHAFRLPAKLHYFLLMWRYIAPGHLLSNAVPRSYGIPQYLQEFTMLQKGRGNEAGNSDAGYGFLYFPCEGREEWMWCGAAYSYQVDDSLSQHFVFSGKILLNRFEIMMAICLLVRGKVCSTVSVWSLVVQMCQKCQLFFLLCCISCSIVLPESGTWRHRSKYSKYRCRIHFT